jgi:hypothetical protein
MYPAFPRRSNLPRIFTCLGRPPRPRNTTKGFPTLLKRQIYSDFHRTLLIILCSQILHMVEDSVLMKDHICVFVSSYFDYVRLRNYMTEKDFSFVSLCEYWRPVFIHAPVLYLLLDIPRIRMSPGPDLNFIMGMPSTCWSQNDSTISRGTEGE